jgi:hypothetical protein
MMFLKKLNSLRGGWEEGFFSWWERAGLPLVGRKGLCPWVGGGGLFPRYRRGIFALVGRREFSLGMERGFSMGDSLGGGGGIFPWVGEGDFCHWDGGGVFSLGCRRRLFSGWGREILSLGGRRGIFPWVGGGGFFPVWEKRNFSLGGRREISAWVGRGGILLMGKKRRISPNGVREGNFSWVWDEGFLPGWEGDFP